MKVPPSPLVSTIDTKAPVIGRPCESTAVPVIRAVRTGSSAKLMPVTSDPTATLSFSACCSLGVPGKYVGGVAAAVRRLAAAKNMPRRSVALR